MSVRRGPARLDNPTVEYVPWEPWNAPGRTAPEVAWYWTAGDDATTIDGVATLQITECDWETPSCPPDERGDSGVTRAVGESYLDIDQLYPNGSVCQVNRAYSEETSPDGQVLLNEGFVSEGFAIPMEQHHLPLYYHLSAPVSQTCEGSRQFMVDLYIQWTGANGVEIDGGNVNVLNSVRETTTAVPDVTGLTQAQAGAAIQAAGLTLGGPGLRHLHGSARHRCRPELPSRHDRAVRLTGAAHGLTRPGDRPGRARRAAGRGGAGDQGSRPDGRHVGAHQQVRQLRHDAIVQCAVPGPGGRRPGRPGFAGGHPGSRLPQIIPAAGPDASAEVSPPHARPPPRSVRLSTPGVPAKWQRASAPDSPALAARRKERALLPIIQSSPPSARSRAARPHGSGPGRSRTACRSTCEPGRGPRSSRGCGHLRELNVVLRQADG